MHDLLAAGIALYAVGDLALLVWWLKKEFRDLPRQRERYLQAMIEREHKR